MPSIERVPMEDIYPSACNPRSDFGDLKALAESFDLNPTNPGEPINPPVVVRDGGIYQIIDGERRYRAMQLRKMTHAHVLVCDDMDEANAVMAMLSTDDKRPLSEIERSRGVQQMLLLGVDPVKVEKAARLKAGTASKAKRALEVVDDAAEDMSLLRLIAIEELSDDPEAVEALTNCSEREFPAIERRIRDARAKAEKVAAIEEALARHGIEKVDELPVSMSHRCLVLSVDDIPDELSPKAVYLLAGSYPAIYEPRPDADPVAEARKARYAVLEGIYKEAKARREKWLVENVERPLPALWAIEEGRPYNYKVNSYLENRGLELPKGPADSICAYLDNAAAPFAQHMDEPSEEACEAFIALTDALSEEGYEPGQDELEVYEAAKAVLEGSNHE